MGADAKASGADESAQLHLTNHTPSPAAVHAADGRWRKDPPMKVRDATAKLHTNICSVFRGKPEAVKLAMVALFARGHLLMEDVPGVGKTLLAKALARSLECSFRRIQFTPDLLPSDILGTTVFNSQASKFVFKPGPIFTNIVLADEINRTTPRTQSSLLEAMSDMQVSVDGRTHWLEQPFMVLATQNPFEFEGTYLLPESQLDRFMMRVRIGYPAREDERLVLRDHREEEEPVDQLQPVMNGEQVSRIQELVRQVRVDEAIDNYILDIVSATRQAEDLLVGASTRAALSLYRASQARALIERRDYVIPDDVKSLAVPVLAHRVIGKNFLQTGEMVAGEAIVEEILANVAPPE